MSLIWKDHFTKYLTMQRNYKIFTADILEKIINSNKKEIQLINYYLKKTPLKVLDIGCGIGIYDLALHDFYKKNIIFYLLDKTTTPDEEKKIYYGYREKGSFYNNLDYTQDFLVSNGIDEKNLHLISVDNNIDITNQYLQNNLTNIDLIISIISCGFHYPIKIYLDTIHKILDNNGILCLHCRNIPENLPLLESKFNILWPEKEGIREGSFLICNKK